MPLLEVEPPKQLTFRFELRKRASCTIRLSNNTDQYVAFKVSTKNPDKYFCSFNYGILLPRSSCHVTVTMHSLTRIPSCMQYKDEISIKSAVATRRDTVESCKKLFKEIGGRVEFHPLDVVYVHQSSNFQRQDQNQRHDGNMFVRGITFILLCFIFGYLVMKMLQFIWTVVFVIALFVINMAKRWISDSIEEWINNTLVYLCIQFLPVILETLLYRCIDCVGASCETFYELCVRFLSALFRQR
ncbi:hypothetical protein ABFX02_01G093500 [Erythranthe guttata]